MKRKYKNITIPYLYYNEKENYSCYILKDKEYRDLNKLFKEFIGFYLTYNYEIDGKEYEVHNLSEVLEALLKASENFKIDKKYRSLYSDEEWDYIHKLQKALINNELKITVNKDKTFNLKDYPNRHLYNYAKEIYHKYANVMIPKKIYSKKYKSHYYVVGGEYYESIYQALDFVYDNNLYYEFGGSNKESNHNHLHTHSFESLINMIFTNNDSFKIHVFQRQYYSEQELAFLTKLSDKLKDMNFHSVKYIPDKEDAEEYNYLTDNKKHLQLLLHNMRWHKFNKEYEEAVLKSHKI